LNPIQYLIEDVFVSPSKMKDI